MSNEQGILNSYYTYRKIIGFLGISLPFIVYYFYGDLLASLSHYYYTKSSVFFTSILTAFGLFLISYSGTKKEKGAKKFSDNRITNIGGWAVLVVVIIPTSCMSSLSIEIQRMCTEHDYLLFGHNNSIKNFIHLFCAGIFLFSMGWMSFFRFTIGTWESGKKMQYLIYKGNGIIIWGSIAILLGEFLVAYFTKTHLSFTEYDVIFLETISVACFGSSWLIYGKSIEHTGDAIKVTGNAIKVTGKAIIGTGGTMIRSTINLKNKLIKREKQ